MKLVHKTHGTTHADSTREVNRLKQYGWKEAPAKKTRTRKEPEPVVEQEQPELPLDTE